MPLILFAYFLADLFSIAFLFVGYYLYKQWDHYETRNNDISHRYLYGLIALSVLILFGKYLIRILLSKGRKEAEPVTIAGDRQHTIARPDGTEIYVEQFGMSEGEPIIFIHGWNSTRNQWYYQIKHFEKKYRVIVMDLRGLGKSTRPNDKDFSLIRLAEDVNAVIEFTKAKNPILWGHSIGGMTILTLVSKLNNIIGTPIKGLILQHTTYTNPVKTCLFDKLATALEKPVLVPFCYIMIALSPIFWISRWMSYVNGNALLISRFLVFAGTQNAKQLDYATFLSTLAPPSVTARGMLAMLKYDVTENLKSIKIPTLIFSGVSDKLTKASASVFINHEMPNSKLVSLHPAGHMGLMERNEEVNTAAGDFLASINVPHVISTTENLH
jgi:pimeloyl-ACP methyl ester carboxylesterase